MIKNIENIELHYLTLEDYHQLKEAMIQVYASMPDSYWRENQIKSLIDKFPEGQVVIKINGDLAGCALSIILDYDKFDDEHTYEDITGKFTFNTHDVDGDILYGIDVFIKKEYRGLRLGRRLYDYRKELAEKLNLRGIAFGGRIPNYHKHAATLSPTQYIEKVKRKEIHDPVLNFQISNDFHPSKILNGYLEGDGNSGEFAVLLEWDNIYYQKKSKKAATKKTVVRLGLIQWQMRLYKDLDELMEQAEFFVDSVSAYRADFALFPEFFNAPLMADYNHLPESKAIRELAKYTPKIVQKFSELAISYNINIITGSMPEIKDELLYNVGYICKRDGTKERYEKLHVTPDEAKIWGTKDGILNSSGFKIGQKSIDREFGKLINNPYVGEFQKKGPKDPKTGKQKLLVKGDTALDSILIQNVQKAVDQGVSLDNIHQTILNVLFDFYNKDVSQKEIETYVTKDVITDQNKLNKAMFTAQLVAYSKAEGWKYLWLGIPNLGTYKVYEIKDIPKAVQSGEIKIHSKLGLGNVFRAKLN